MACGTSKYAENRSFLKEYAFCQCVQYATGDSFHTEDISKGIYRDIAKYDPEVYDELDSFSKQKALTILPSAVADHEGKKAVFFNCFRFFHSKELDSMVRKMDNRINKGW